MNDTQHGFINFGTMTLLVGGLALAGLLVYGAVSGQQLPLWPAIAVILVNVIAAGKLAFDTRKKRQQQAAAPSGSAQSESSRR